MSALSREQVESHLAAILASKSFAHSKRCSEFLKFVVEATLAGDSESLKERTLGVEVFGRGPDYDPSQDSVVRVKATEVRRRLREYYEKEAPDSPLHIELPIGTYVPRIYEAPRRKDQQGSPKHNHLNSLGSLLWFGCVLGLVALLAVLVWRRSLGMPPRSSVEQIWEPILRENDPVLICLPVLPPTGSKAPTGDRVGLGAAYAAIHLAAFCVQHRHPYLVKMGDMLSFSDLRNHPAVLLGAFSSSWTLMMNRGLRFELLNPSGNAPQIVDSRSGHQFYAQNLRTDGHADADFAIAARLLDSQSGKPIILAAGITTFGTQSAMEFLLSSGTVSQLLSRAPKYWSHRNFQALISTHIVGNTPGPPQLVAAEFW
jgi:hypothetical protein